MDKIASRINGLAQCFVSPNECDSNFESANVVDGLYFLGRNVTEAANCLGLKGASTQMGALELLSFEVKNGFERLACSVDGLADAIRDTGKA